MCVSPGGATLARAYNEACNILIFLHHVGRVSAAPPGKKESSMGERHSHCAVGFSRVAPDGLCPARCWCWKMHMRMVFRYSPLIKNS